MKNNIYIQHDVTIPEHELEITTSRSGGAGGQHVNKTDTRITIRWNVKNTHVLNEVQKQRVLEKLAHRLTADGDLLIHNSESRSQQHNRKMALDQLAREIKKALHVPKKRMQTRIPHAAKEAQLQSKKHHSMVKKMRSKKFLDD